MGNIEKLLKGRSRTTWFGRVLILSVCLISALMIGQAQAGDILSLFKEGTNQGSDENSEYLIDRVGNVKGQIDVGDSLRGIVGINTLNSSNANVGGTTGNNEWTGVYQIKVVSKEEIGETGSGAWKFTFEPDPDFEEDLSGGIGSLNGFVPGDGAIVVMFEGSPNNFALGFNDPLPSTPPDGPDDGTTVQTVPPSSEDVSVGPYVIEEQFVALAVDGEYFWTLGFAGEPGEGFEVTAPTGDNILFSFGITSGSVILGFNAGLTRLFNGNHGTGDTVSIAPITTSPFEGGTVEFAVSGSGRGVFDLDTPFEVSTNLNLSFNVQEEEEPAVCRVTAGGNKDGVTVPCVLKSNLLPDLKTCADDITHTWGGQVGAAANRVDGSWTHHFKSKNDSFVFHSNDIRCIMCSDPGDFCFPARDAPYRQIDFTGIGQFSNKKGFDFPVRVPLCFEVHLEDIGEPGQGGQWPSSVAQGLECEHCPGTPIVNGDDPDDPDTRSDCRDCTDYYEIKIYNNAEYDDCGCTGNVVLWKNGSLDTDRCTDPQLEGFFTRAGNVQMHPDNK